MYQILEGEIFVDGKMTKQLKDQLDSFLSKKGIVESRIFKDKYSFTVSKYKFEKSVLREPQLHDFGRLLEILIIGYIGVKGMRLKSNIAEIQY